MSSEMVKEVAATFKMVAQAMAACGQMKQE